MTEDLAAFLADFGVTCVANGVTFSAIFDMPDSEFSIGNGSMQSREYKITYQTTAVTLKSTDAVMVNGTAYFVRSYPNTIDDGVWSEAMLSKS